MAHVKPSRVMAAMVTAVGTGKSVIFTSCLFAY